MANVLIEAGMDGPRTATARRWLPPIFVFVAVLYVFRFGLPGIVLGGDYIADGADVTAQLDSETRFLSMVALGVGIGSLWLARNYETFAKGALLLVVISFLGGLTRLVSMAVIGVPGFIAIVAIVFEIVIPVVTLVLLARRET
ncbi:MAG: DUF4345 domain-containing protein [Acidimicrobiia bacterium]|nr:DUF4345 domain-containing protein [Acidimicrobiia bacterium]